MRIKKLTLSLSLALLAATASAQCYTKSQQQGWLDKAEACKPVIKKTIHHPVREVKIVADKDGPAAARERFQMFGKVKR